MKKKSMRIPLAKEALGSVRVAVALIILSIVLGAGTSHPFFYWLGAACGVLLCFIFYFFRDPERIIPDDPDAIVAPADGVILDIREIAEGEFVKEKSKEISIFLSLFDVHINRVPISGKVELFRYQPGRFHAAYSGKASENEHTVIGMSNVNVKVLIKQVAGIIARRIICRLRRGMTAEKGARLGMIAFGSRTDLIVPSWIQILVHPEQHVRGGETIIGKIIYEK